jgi:hypothetical protein
VNKTRHALYLVALLALGGTTSADEAAATIIPPSYRTLPADCSSATVPPKPLELSIAGAAAAAKSIELEHEKGSMTENGDAYERYNLFIDSGGYSARLKLYISFYPHRGQNLEGAAFRLPDTDGRGNFALSYFDFEDTSAKLDFSSTDLKNPPTMRLEFGRRQGNSISGTLFVCAPKGQTDSGQTIGNDSYAIGTFLAKIR